VSGWILFLWPSLLSKSPQVKAGFQAKIAPLLHVRKSFGSAENLARIEFYCLKVVMPNRSTDALFQLICSLQKAEKRNFKLYAKRNFSNKDLRILQLFDALDKMDHYDEELLLKREPEIKKEQLSNIKAKLYKQLLASMRLLESEDNIDIQLHEQLDFARILYNKGLYLQSLKLLDKIKELARANNQISFLVQALFMVKKIESLHITRSMQDKAEQLERESEEVAGRVARITTLSNVALQLYSWYIKNGHARNEEDEAEVTRYFQSKLPADLTNVKGFYERLYLYQSYCWYAFIRQDFLMYYRYTHKWVDVFGEQPFMVDIETAHYIKGMHNLLTAHFYLRNYRKFIPALEQFEQFYQRLLDGPNDNNKIQTFVYLHISKINQYFLEGDFKRGLELVTVINQQLKAYEIYLDKHRVLIFYYKIASLYFGAGDYEHTIEYLNKIINWKTDLRTDLQCYARLLHLIAHYELDNFKLIEYLVRSVYRFMAKMNNLSRVEEEILKFLKSSFYLPPKQLTPAFEQLLNKLKKLVQNRFETRAFVYLDIISWLESKVTKQPLETVLRNRFLHSAQS
jgi:hypothetical protein